MNRRVFRFTALTLSYLGALAGVGVLPARIAAEPKKPADGFYAYDEGSSSSSRARSSSSMAPRKIAGDYGRYKEDFSDLCRLVEADGRRMLLYQALLTINVADRRCVDCRPFARAFSGPCRPAELRQKKKKITSSASSEAPEDGPVEVMPTATPTPMPARLPSLAVNQKLLELGRKFAADEGRNSETLRALDKLAMVLSSDEGLTPGEREYGETFSAFLTSPFAELRKVFADRQKEAEREAADDASIDDILGDSGGSGPAKPKGTEGLFE